MLIKKITSAILAVAMVAAMSTTVFAEETTPDNTGETKSTELTADDATFEGTTFLAQNDAGEVTEKFVAHDPSTPNYTLPSGATTFDLEDGSEISTFDYKYNWEQVSSISSTPYNAIVQLVLTFPHKTTYGTGFVVGDGKIVTAAHNIYDNVAKEWVSNIKISFGKNGSSATQVVNTRISTIPSTWQTSTTTEELYGNDYGFITVDKSVTDRTNKFGMYAGPTTNYNYTIAGYPIKSGSFDGTKMYKDNARVAYDFGYCIQHEISVCTGISGAPVFDSNNYAIAIQTYGYSNPASTGAGYATRLTQSVIDFIRIN